MVYPFPLHPLLPSDTWPSPFHVAQKHALHSPRCQAHVFYHIHPHGPSLPHCPLTFCHVSLPPQSPPPQHLPPSTCPPMLHVASTCVLSIPHGIPHPMSPLPFIRHRLHSIGAITPIIPSSTSAVGVPHSSPAKQHPKKDRSADPGGTIRRPPCLRRQS
jgi:hypothetical protein